jgi:hypothetical protein
MIKMAAALTLGLALTASLGGTADATTTRAVDTVSVASAATSAASTTKITVDGLGPYQAGARAAALVHSGYLVRRTTGVCVVWYEPTEPYAPAVFNVQVRDGAVRSVGVSARKYTTVAGARVGMLESALKRTYGTGLRHLNGPGTEYDDGWTIRSGGRALVFLVHNDRVRWIVAGYRANAEGAVTNGEYYPC